MLNIFLRPSLFNHLTRRDNGSGIAYNFLWRSMALLTAEESDSFLRLNEKSFVGSTVDSKQSFGDLDPEVLAKLRFVISSDFNEVEFFRKHYFASLMRPVLTAMILPTLGCNFDCPYCFEYKRDATLSPKTIAFLKDWLAQRLYNKKHFHITWFGGEPLLALPEVEDLSRFGSQVSAKRGIKFSGSIVTNGYLLNQDVIRLLQGFNIYNFHVTLDGDRDDHDQTRYLATSHEGSFERLRENIEVYCRISTSHLPLGLRINVSDANYGGIPSLLRRFSDVVKRGSRIYFRWIWTTEASGHKIFVTQQKRPFDKLYELYKAATQAGYLIDNPIDHIQFNYCEVDFASHYTFDPQGYIYLCSHKFLPEEAIGHVIHEPNIEENQQYKQWINANPFSDIGCMSCKILPICKGSCRKVRVAGSKACLEEKLSIDKYVESQFLKHQAISKLQKERSNGNII